MNLKLLTNYILFRTVHDDVIDITDVGGGHGREHAWRKTAGAETVRSFSNRLFRA